MTRNKYSRTLENRQPSGMHQSSVGTMRTYTWVVHPTTRPMLLSNADAGKLYYLVKLY